jgi:hypothetical protein
MTVCAILLITTPIVIETIAFVYHIACEALIDFKDRLWHKGSTPIQINVFEKYLAEYNNRGWGCRAIIIRI